jgi:hypothetical protein
MSANLYLPRSDQSLNDLGDDVAMGKASFERGKERYRRQGKDPVHGLAAADSIRLTWGFQRSRTNRSSLRYAGPEASIACERLASTPKKSCSEPRPMKDADARREMREVAACYERLAQQVEQLSGEADNA